MSDRLPLELERFPLPPEIDGEGAVRAWALNEVEHQVFTMGSVPDRLALVGNGWVELALLADLIRRGAALAAAVLLHPTLRPDVHFRLRTGQIPIDDTRSLSVALQVLPDDRWWLATRAFSDGVFLEPWHASEGAGVDELPTPLKLWLDREGSSVQAVEQRSAEPTSLRAYVSAADPWPENLAALCKVVASPIETLWLAGNDAGVTVVACRDGVRERWEVHGELPTNLPDVIRAIAQQGDALQAIALVHVGIIKQEGSTKPALITVVERQGQRATRALVASEDRQHIDAVLFAEQGQVGEDGWIDVPPTTDPGLVAVRATTGFGEAGEA